MDDALCQASIACALCGRKDVVAMGPADAVQHFREQGWRAEGIIACPDCSTKKAGVEPAAAVSNASE